MNIELKQYCEICYQYPLAHSFQLVGNTLNSDHEYIFYTRVSIAKRYNDTPGILQHYQKLLDLLSPVSWIWIFDCNGFEWKHAMEIQTAIGICKIIEKYPKVKIIIINTNKFINIVLHITKYYLSKDIIKNIVMIKKDEKDKYLHLLQSLRVGITNFNELEQYMSSY